MSSQEPRAFATADVPFADFRSGLPVGRFRVIVNPERAKEFVRQRLMVRVLSLPLLGIGVALAISGHPWLGVPFVAVGMLGPRIVRKKSSEILLYLASHDAAIYREVVEREIMEVRALLTDEKILGEASGDA